MFVEANYFCERDKNGEGIGGNSRKKLLPKRDDEQKNQQTNKERQSYSANRLWKAEMSNFEFGPLRQQDKNALSVLRNTLYGDRVAAKFAILASITYYACEEELEGWMDNSKDVAVFIEEADNPAVGDEVIKVFETLSMYSV